MWLRIILGGLYSAMAAAQAASWSRMPAILSAYDAVPAGALPWLAAALIAAEAVCGVWLLTRPRSRAVTPVWVYTAVSGLWALLGLQAQLRGLAVDNCGCFGSWLSQRLSWWVLAQDALLLVYAVVMLRTATLKPTESARIARGARTAHGGSTRRIRDESIEDPQRHQAAASTRPAGAGLIRHQNTAAPEEAP